MQISRRRRLVVDVERSMAISIDMIMIMTSAPMQKPRVAVTARDCIIEFDSGFLMRRGAELRSALA